MNQTELIKATTEVEKEAEALTVELMAKKTIAREMRRQVRKNIPFSQTRFGKVYFGSMRFITKPFANMHNHADENLTDPVGAEARSLFSDGRKVLATCEKIENNSTTKAHRMALIAAKQNLKLEAFMDLRGEMLDMRQISHELDTAVQRLRPPKDKVVADTIKEAIEEVLEKASA